MKWERHSWAIVLLILILIPALLILLVNIASIYHILCIAPNISLVYNYI